MNNSMEDGLGEVLVTLASSRDDFVILGSGDDGDSNDQVFRDTFPDRFIQCGRAEQNMVSLAAGISSTGVIPIVTCSAVSAMRAIMQVRNTVAYPDFNVKIAVSHLGLDVGPAGVIFQSLEDISIFRSIPNFTVISPADSLEMSAALPVMLETQGPFYLRTGRASLPAVYSDIPNFRIGKADIIRHGNDVTIVAVGVMVHRALEAAKNLEKGGIFCRVLNISSIKPLDRETVVKAAYDTGAMVTAEDHTGFGGLGGAIAECLVANIPVPMEQVAVNDVYGESGAPEDLSKKYNLMPVDIQGAVYRVLARKRGDC
jgi:transketolase